MSLNQKSYFAVLIFAAVLNTLQATLPMRSPKKQQLQKNNASGTTSRIEVVDKPSEGMRLFNKTEFCSALGAARGWEVAHPTVITIDVAERWASSLYQIVLTNSESEYKSIEIVSKEIDSEGRIVLGVAWWGKGNGLEIYRIPF